MKKNRIIAIVLAVALVGSLAGVSAFAASGNTQSAPAADTAAQKKDVQETAASHTSSETVYVIANADGSAQKVIVSQKYDADDANAAQEAQSTLTDPQNVKGDNCWQGTTDKALPVTVAITYTLDGKTVTAEELAGKSGHVTMRFDYTNTQYETKTIGGKQEKIYVPFAVLTGALLDSDRFTNVTVTNGKLVDDGDHTVVVGMAFPGLQETLALDTDTLEIPTYVEVEADVTGFTLDTTLTVVSNSLLNDMDDDKLDDSALDDLSADMDKLTDAMTQLMDGSDELYDGLDTLLDSSKELSDGVGKLTSGLKKLDSNSAQLNAGAETVFNTLLDTVNTQLQANEELKEAVGKELPTLTISNYYDELNALIRIFDKDNIREKVDQTLREQVTAAVEAKDAEFRAGVTTAVKASVTEEVTAAVEKQVQETLRPQVWAGVLQQAGITQEQYDALPEGSETKAQLDAALESTLAQQMASETVQQQISALVEQNVAAQMETDKVKAIIEENVKAQKAQKVEETLVSPEIQAKRQEALDKALGSAESAGSQLLAVRQQLDSYNVFYQGLKSYTAGVAEAKDGAVKLNSNMPDLIDGVKKLRDGAGELADGLKELNEEGIQKLVDAFDGDLELLSDRLRAARDASRSYQGFTTSSSDGVKFIFRTEAIETEE